jgi:hypothetical protein
MTSDSMPVWSFADFRLRASLLLALLLAAGCADEQAPGFGKRGSTSGGDDGEVGTEAAVALAGVAEGTFNPVGAEVRFEIQGGSFDPDPDTVVLLVNGLPAPEVPFTVSPGAVVVPAVLTDGVNVIELYAQDAAGLSVYAAARIWSGSNTLEVTVRDEDGALVDDAEVVVSLAREAEVSATGRTRGGKVTFTNLPLQTLAVTASAAGNRFVTLAVRGDARRVEARLVGFAEPSSIDNNDFAQGLAGWNVAGAPVDLIAHEE